MTTNPDVLRFAYCKGSLESETEKLLREANLPLRSDLPSNQYVDLSSDPAINMMKMRPATAAQLLGECKLDAAIIGSDWILETYLDKTDISLDPMYLSRSRNPLITWVLAVPSNSPVTSIEEFASTVKNARGSTKIATEMPTLTSRWFNRYDKQITARLDIEVSPGATEIYTRLGAQAVVEASDSGETLRANGLKPIATLLSSTAVFVCSRSLLRDVSGSSNDPQRARTLWKIRESLVQAVAPRNKEPLSIGLESLCL